MCNFDNEEKTLNLNELIISNMKLVYSIVNTFHDKKNYDDLVEEGRIGLLKGIQHYDPSKGAFSTGVSYWIKREIYRFYEKENRHKDVVSLDMSVSDDSDTTLLDMIPDNKDDKIERSNEIIDELSNCLTLEEFDVICSFNGLGNYDKETIESIASRYHTDTKNIYKIKARASKKIKDNSNLRLLATYNSCNYQ